MNGIPNSFERIAMSAADPGLPSPALTISPYLERLDGRLRLMATHCGDCGFNNFPPSTVCPSCLSLSVAPLALSAEGVLYSYTTVRHAKADAFAGYVDFPEKIRVFGHLRGFTPASPPRCDLRVQLVAAEPVPGATSGAPIDFAFEKAGGQQ